MLPKVFNSYFFDYCQIVLDKKGCSKMFRFRNKKDDSRYVDWVTVWDIKFPVLKRIKGKWKLVPKTYHFEREFRAMPIKEVNIYSKTWKSKKSDACFELVLGRRERG